MASPAIVMKECISLALDTPLGSTVGTAHPAPDQALPYVNWGETDVSDSPVGYEITATLHTWSSFEGPDEVEAIQHIIRTTLAATTVTRSSWTFVFLLEEFCTVLFDPNETDWHGVQRFKVLATAV